MIFVAEDSNGKIVGSVMVKHDDDQPPEKKFGRNKVAHITLLSVLRTHRKLGIASKLMKASEEQMKNCFDCTAVTLHVRVSNKAAIALYQSLGYEIILARRNHYHRPVEHGFFMRLKLQDEIE